MSNPGIPYGYQGYDPTGQQANLQARQRLIQGLMQPSQPSNTGWGGLSNAGSAIAGALAQRGLQGQQQQMMQNQIAGNNPLSVPATSNANVPAAMAQPSAMTIPQAQIPQQPSAVSSWLGNMFGGGGGS